MKNARTHYGFTLIEFMIVAAILAILAAVALPAYQDYQRQLSLRNLGPQPVMQARLQQRDFSLTKGVRSVECDNYRQEQAMFRCAVSLDGEPDEGRHRLKANGASLAVPAMPSYFMVRVEKQPHADGFTVKAQLDRAAVTPDAATKYAAALVGYAQTTVIAERDKQVREAAEHQAARDLRAGIPLSTGDSPSEKAWAEAERQLAPAH